MERYIIMENGKKENLMDKEFDIGKMEIKDMKENLKKEKLMEKELDIMKTGR